MSSMRKPCSKCGGPLLPDCQPSPLAIILSTKPNQQLTVLKSSADVKRILFCRSITTLIPKLFDYNNKKNMTVSFVSTSRWLEAMIKKKSALVVDPDAYAIYCTAWIGPKQKNSFVQRQMYGCNWTTFFLSTLSTNLRKRPLFFET